MSSFARREFLKGKLVSFNAFLRESSTDADAVAAALREAEGWTVEAFAVFAATHLAPALAVGGLGPVIDAIAAKFALRDEPAVRDKLRRYLEMTVDVLELRRAPASSDAPAQPAPGGSDTHAAP